jgi:bidirectional [NiFe] hydrogenase diaphorase subunit
MSTVHTLRIDGIDVAAADGQSILTVARENGIRIPTMCHLDGLTDTGACRVCIVEIGAASRPTPACTTLATEGMEVVTASEALVAYRRMIVEMLFLERNHFCAICVANNHCELQDLAEELNVDHFELPAINPSVGVDASHPLFTIDHNRCIMCLRCVRVCDEIEGAHTWDVMGAGIDSRVVTDLGTPWGESTTCTSCGKCVQVCPTGALFERGRAIAEGGKERRPFLPFLKTHHRDGEP